MKAEDAKRLKALERENAKLKRIVADQLLENQALKELAKGTGEPSWRRQAVSMLIERLDISERRACQITGHHRSTQYHQPLAGAERDDGLRAAAEAVGRPSSLGLSQDVGGVVRDVGWSINRKKIHRLWRE